MRRRLWSKVITVLVCGTWWLAADLSPTAFAQVDEEEFVDADETDFRRLEVRLDEIEEQIRRADELGEERRVEQLREEGERLLDRLEKLERSRRLDEDEEEEGRHLRELEIHRLRLEIERLNQDLASARQEASIRLAKIASDPLASASHAVSQTIELLGEEAAIDFLSELRQSTQDTAVKRILGHYLVRLHVHADQTENARQLLRELILE